MEFIPANSAKRPMSDVASIQYLRGIAAMMVVLAHANDLPLLGGGHRVFRDVGWSGVDLFFVISGFVMTYTSASHSYTRRQFLLRRIARIAPLYWVMTFLTAILAISMPSLFLHTSFRWDEFAASLVFLPYKNSGNGGVEPLLKLGWTLNYEMFFYLCFAILIGIASWRRVALLSLMFGILTVVSVALRPPYPPMIFYGNPVTFEFVLGCAVGTAYLKGWLSHIPLQVSLVLGLSGLALLIAGSIVDDQLHSRELFRGIPSAIVVFSCIAVEGRALFKNQWLHKLGDATYSIYLTHLFTLLGLRWTFVHFGLLQTDLSIWLFIFLVTGVSATIGLVTYTYFEVKLTKLASAVLLHPGFLVIRTPIGWRKPKLD
jgi:exopolysaccharide production protein ExoZ